MRKVLLIISLFVALAVQAQNWTVNAADYRYDMTAWIVVGHEGKAVTTNTNRYELAAFVNGVCRGISTLVTKDGYSWRQIRIYSNQEQGETVVFKCYDSSTGEITTYPETIPFNSASLAGMPSEPIALGEFAVGDVHVDGVLDVRDVKLLSELVTGKKKVSDINPHARPYITDDEDINIIDIVKLIDTIKSH